MSEVLLHDSDGLMLLCIREQCMAGYIRKVEKGRNGRVHTLCYLVCAWRKISHQGVSGRYLHIVFGESAWAAHGNRLAQER